MRPVLVALHAHPDDEAIFTGGTIVRAVEAGWRVVLVLATDGDRGAAPGRSSGEVATHRRAEAATAAAILGIERVEFLGYGDSGWADTAGGRSGVASARGLAGGSLAAAHLGNVADSVRRILVEEHAVALTSYDDNGIYGHIDHVQVHEIAVRAVVGTPCELYEATLDRAALRRLAPGSWPEASWPTAGQRSWSTGSASSPGPDWSPWTSPASSDANWRRWPPTPARWSRPPPSWACRPAPSTTSSAPSGSGRPGWARGASGTCCGRAGPHSRHGRPDWSTRRPADRPVPPLTASGGGDRRRTSPSGGRPPTPRRGDGRTRTGTRGPPGAPRPPGGPDGDTTLPRRHRRRLEDVHAVVARTAHPTAGGAQRAPGGARRRRVRPTRVLRVGHRHPGHRRAGRRRRPADQLPHHRTVLAHPRVPADRAEPPPQRTGPGRRPRRSASPATTARSRRRTATSPRSSATTAGPPTPWASGT